MSLTIVAVSPPQEVLLLPYISARSRGIEPSHSSVHLSRPQHLNAEPGICHDKNVDALLYWGNMGEVGQGKFVCEELGCGEFLWGNLDIREITWGLSNVVKLRFEKCLGRNCLGEL